MTNSVLALVVALGMVYSGSLLVVLGGWFIDYVVKVNHDGGPIRSAYAVLLRRPMGWVAGALALAAGLWRMSVWVEDAGVESAPVGLPLTLAAVGLVGMVLVAVAGRTRVVRAERALPASVGRSARPAVPPGREEVVDWAGRRRVVTSCLLLLAAAIVLAALVFGVMR